MKQTNLVAKMSKLSEASGKECTVPRRDKVKGHPHRMKQKGEEPNTGKGPSK
jgi:hypothetical protein